MFSFQMKAKWKNFLGVHISNEKWTEHAIKYIFNKLASLIPILTELGIDGPPARHEHHDTPSNEVLLSDPNGAHLSKRNGPINR